MSTGKSGDQEETNKSEKAVTPPRKNPAKNFSFNIPKKNDLKDAMGGGFPEPMANLDVPAIEEGEEIGELKKGQLDKNVKILSDDKKPVHEHGHGLEQEQGTKKESKEEVVTRSKSSTSIINQNLEDLRPRKEKKSVGRPEGRNYSQSSMTVSFKHDRWLDAVIFDKKMKGDPDYSKREALENALDLLFDHVGLDENKVAAILRSKEKYFSSKGRP